MDEVQLGEEPPEYGRLRIDVDVPPVSMQAKKYRRVALQDGVRAKVASAGFYLSGEVHVDNEWMMNEKYRYETDASPDVDNILKPIIDGLKGTTGIIVDDVQVQSIACRWLDWTKDDQHLSIRIDYMGDEWLEKNNLVFVAITKTLCFPMRADETHEVAVALIDLLKKQVALKEEIESKTGDYSLARRVMPIQRFFHRSRLPGFTVASPEDYLRSRPQVPPATSKTGESEGTASK